jgi:hypothetical protein
MPELDITTLITELGRRYDIRLDHRDPAIAIVAMNRLILETATEELTESFARRVAQFEAAMQKIEQRVAKILAEELAQAAARMRAELQNDIEAAGAKAAHFIYLVDRAHKRPMKIMWMTAGLLSAIAILCFGVFAGVHLHP